jgi:hypothetical protein
MRGRFLTLWLLGKRILMHRLQSSHQDDFWAWLYQRVCDPKSPDFSNETLVWFLLSQAMNAGEHVRVVALYRYFQKIIDRKATETHKRRIVASIDAASARQLNENRDID